MSLAPINDPSPTAKAGDADPRIFRLHLDPAFARSWNEVNARRVVVRTPGRQTSLAAVASPDAAFVDFAVTPRGCAMVVAELGDPGTHRAVDPWQLVTRQHKLVACDPAAPSLAALDARVAATPMVLAKTGGRLEIQPLASPTLLRPDRDLPVRVFRDGAPLVGAAVTVAGPDGPRSTVVTDAIGAATVRIDAAGSWSISARFAARQAGEPLVGNLAFEVASEDFWQTIDALRSAR